METREKIISLKNISKVYGKKEVLKDFNFDIYKGDRIAYLGGNGSGKSTTVEIIAKVKKQTSGEVWYAPNTKVGIQFQESKYPLGITTEILINFYLDRFGREGISEDYLDNLLETFRLKDLLKRQVNSMSGGQQQRLNILLALVHQPNFLILDELSTGLDIKIRREIRAYIYKYLADHPDCSLILVTHHISEAKKMCNRVVVLEKGNIVEDASIKDLEMKYGTLETYADKLFDDIYQREKEEKDLQKEMEKEQIKTKKSFFAKKKANKNKRGEE